MEVVKRRDLERIEGALKVTKRLRSEDPEILERLPNKVIKEGDEDFLEIKKSFLIPAAFHVHLQILNSEFLAFRAGDESGLGLSLARMNSVLDSDPGGPVIVGETIDQSRTSVRRWLSRLNSQIDAIGNLSPSPLRRKIFNCSKIVYKKLANFAETGKTAPPGNSNDESDRGIFLEIQKTLGPELKETAIYFFKFFRDETSVEAARKFRRKFLQLDNHTKYLEICTRKPWLFGVLVHSSPSVIERLLI